MNQRNREDEQGAVDDFHYGTSQVRIEVEASICAADDQPDGGCLADLGGRLDVGVVVHHEFVSVGLVEVEVDEVAVVGAAVGVGVEALGFEHAEVVGGDGEGDALVESAGLVDGESDRYVQTGAGRLRVEDFEGVAVGVGGDGARVDAEDAEGAGDDDDQQQGQAGSAAPDRREACSCRV